MAVGGTWVSPFQLWAHLPHQLPAGGLQSNPPFPIEHSIQSSPQDMIQGTQFLELGSIFRVLNRPAGLGTGWGSV